MHLGRLWPLAVHFGILMSVLLFIDLLNFMAYNLTTVPHRYCVMLIGSHASIGAIDIE